MTGNISRADKTVSQMTESKNLEVSDAEAKVIQVERNRNRFPGKTQKNFASGK